MTASTDMQGLGYSMQVASSTKHNEGKAAMMGRQPCMRVTEDVDKDWGQVPTILSVSMAVQEE